MDPRPEAYCLKKTPNVDACAENQTKKWYIFHLSAFANLYILLTPCYPLRENPCKEGLLVQLAKKFLTRFYVFFKSVDFVLLQEIEPFLHLLHQSSNSIFDFNLRASYARLSFQVNETCWKSPKLNRRILAYFTRQNQFFQKRSKSARQTHIFKKRQNSSI